MSMCFSGSLHRPRQHTHTLLCALTVPPVTKQSFQSGHSSQHRTGNGCSTTQRVCRGQLPGHLTHEAVSLAGIMTARCPRDCPGSRGASWRGTSQVGCPCSLTVCPNAITNTQPLRSLGFPIRVLLSVSSGKVCSGLVVVSLVCFLSVKAACQLQRNPFSRQAGNRHCGGP